MRALVKGEAEPGLRLEEVEEPSIGPEDVLIRVKKTAVCGTDLHIYNWDTWAQRVVQPPLVIGHEFSGEIARVGEAVTEYTVGQRVTAEGHMSCGHCRTCRTGKAHLCAEQKGLGVHRQGCFADYVQIPQSNVFVLPDEIDDELGSILDPLGNAVHTALSYPLQGENILITGAGPIGLMCTAIAKFVGAHSVTITDVHPQRLKLASELGADYALNVQRNRLTEYLPSLNIANGFGVGLELSGHPSAFESMVQAMAPGGQMALLGFLPDDTPVEWNKILFKGLKIKGIYGREIFQTWYQMTSLLQSGLDVRPIITHRFPCEEFEAAFSALQEGTASKIILDWS